jgi:hypothetical protein
LEVRLNWRIPRVVNHALLVNTVGKMVGQLQALNRIIMLVMQDFIVSLDLLSLHQLMVSQVGFVLEVATALRVTLILNPVMKPHSMHLRVVNLMLIALNVGLVITAEAQMMVSLKEDASRVKFVLRELLILRILLNQVTTHLRDHLNNSSAPLVPTLIKQVHLPVCNVLPVKTVTNTR